ncbi:MarR family transcriptional regulator [Gudongella oleilytica]|jgi:DNA-binding MarR family transcriptional regulator|uniref:MarR family winged helix-turn-helix transcriptional regulator n=1 Tax=Gudongella oleilytica TaxID=1582259 RepID=UPI002A366AFD|nr:MarR family transcriptional regulator [Gudongella oleilytica]MDY0256748.1 MarR family transcriptional regulator [Gudongella oleilytica]
MEASILKDRMIKALESIYYMEAFHQVVEFLQGELYILHHMLEHEDEGINPSGLSDMLHISRPRVTTALATLRRKGYVETRIDEDDRRRLTVYLTASGREFITGRQNQVEEYFTGFIEKLGEDKAEELIGLLDVIVDMLGKNDIEMVQGKGSVNE